MLKLSIEVLRLDLKFSWKISRGSTDFKLNYLIRFSDNRIEGMGEVAPNVRYNESNEIIIKQFENILSELPENFTSLIHFNEWLDTIEVCNSLRFGIESAFLHFYCKKNNTTIFDLLKIVVPKPVATSFSLPIMGPDEMIDFYNRFDLRRFKLLKIKIEKNNAFEAIKSIAEYSEKPLMIDANEAWEDVDELINLFEKIKKFEILFIEQPLPSSMVNEYKYLFRKSRFEIIADESVTDKPDFNELKTMFHGVNMKLMKAGGYQKGLQILNHCHLNGMKQMIGCMVESSLGIRSAYNLSYGVQYIDLDSFLYIINEPFKVINEKNGILSN